MRSLLISASVIALIVPFTAHAQEVVTYVYDDLGRLIVTRTSGVVRDGQEAGTSFDPAGNRTNYRVIGVGGVSLPPPPTPTPPPPPPVPIPSPPPPANNPPVTVSAVLTQRTAHPRFRIDHRNTPCAL